MTTTTVIREGYDTWVSSTAATQKHPNDNRIRLRSNASYGYLYFPLGPELRNATILRATLYLYGRGEAWGSQTVTVHAITGKWDAGTLTWSNRPAVGTTTATRTQGNPTNPTEWAIPVSGLVQEFASGARWRGMRISIDDTVERAFNSLEAGGLKPRLEVTWTQAPGAPVDLAPAGERAVSTSRPVLTWSNENTPSGSSLAAFEVQIDPAANETTPAFSSGVRLSSVAEYDLSQSAYPGLANGAGTQWRVGVIDATGMRSDWSDWAAFTRVDKGTVAILTPGSTVAEYTPPVAWSTSLPQSAWQVIVTDAEDTSLTLHDTGRKTGTTQDYTIPAKDETTGKRILRDGRDYRLEVRTWDAVDREATPGDPRFSSAVRVFTYADDPTPDQVAFFSARQVRATPYVDLTWTRTTTPDSWTITDNGKVVETAIPGAELLVTGQTYTYRCKAVTPGRHTFRAKATVNGVTSASPATILQVQPSGVWVIGEVADDGTDLHVHIVTQDVGVFSMPDRGTTFVLPGSRTPTRINQGVGGYQGSVTGRLTDTHGLSVNDWRDRMLELKRLSKPVTLFLGLDVIRAVIFNVVVDPSRDGGQTRAVSFEFFQVGDVDWLDD